MASNFKCMPGPPSPKHAQAEDQPQPQTSRKQKKAVKYPATVLVAPFLMTQKGIKGVSVISSQRAIVSYKTTTQTGTYTR